MQSADYWIEQLQLTPHPEGGFFRETHRSAHAVQPIMPTQETERMKSACTSIYYLLQGNERSHFHRLTSEELWYFHVGSPILVHQIGPDGHLITHRLGLRLDHHETLFLHIPAGVWFGAEVENQAGYGLVSCAVAPGFEFDDFELATRKQLTALYPQHESMIHRLTRPE